MDSSAAAAPPRPAPKKKPYRGSNFAHLYQELQKFPALHIKQLVHQLSCAHAGPATSDLNDQIAKILLEKEMGPFAPLVSQDSAFVSKLVALNAEKLLEFDAQISKANEGLSQSDVVELMLSKAIYLCQIGDKDASILLLRQLEEKCPTTGSRLDFAFASIRLGFLWDDMDIVKRNIAKAERYFAYLLIGLLAFWSSGEIGIDATACGFIRRFSIFASESLARPPVFWCLPSLPLAIQS